jgi:SAM-dependent methyltransferase
MSSKFIIDENKPHLGGNTIRPDKNTWSPSSWTYLIEKFDIKKMTDLGSGQGHTSQWFKEKGVEVTAVEGLEFNVKNSVVPAILHDLTVAPFEQDTDLVLCVEVVEHIEEIYLEFLLTSLCQGKILFMTHAVPGQPGYHHVNCRDSEYWIDHISRKGYNLLEKESQEIRKLADTDKARHLSRNGMIFLKK